MRKTYRIGDLARQLSVSVETIRYYESEGLLPNPRRSDGNYRLYSDAERERLSFILNCRALDMTLDEIRHLLRLQDRPETGCAEVNAALDQHIEHVADRLRALRRLQADLRTLRARCQSPTSSAACEILRDLAAPSKREAAASRSGVHSRLLGR